MLYFLPGFLQNALNANNISDYDFYHAVMTKDDTVLGKLAKLDLSVVSMMNDRITRLVNDGENPYYNQTFFSNLRTYVKDNYPSRNDILTILPRRSKPEVRFNRVEDLLFINTDIFADDIIAISQGNLTHDVCLKITSFYLENLLKITSEDLCKTKSTLRYYFKLIKQGNKQ